MFGYACDETPELMPAPIMYAHELVQNLAKLRKSKKLTFLRPDSKSQGHHRVRARQAEAHRCRGRLDPAFRRREAQGS